MGIKFSIIVPNYNKAAYIDFCINSILNQTYNNYEIIVIDDGSNDNSLEIISRYDVLLYKTNRLGAGGARNLGLKHASGDYIVFLDSDDYFTDNLVLEKLSKTITDEDLVFLNYTKDNFGEKEFIVENEEDISFKIENTRNLGCPTKCFRRDLISDIKFPESKSYEDMVFTIEAMCKARKVTYFKDSFFTYRKVQNSNTTSYITGEVMTDILEELVKFYKLCFKYPKYKMNILNRLKKDKLNTRLDILNTLIEFDKNTFYDYFN